MFRKFSKKIRVEKRDAVVSTAPTKRARVVVSHCTDAVDGDLKTPLVTELEYQHTNPTSFVKVSSFNRKQKQTASNMDNDVGTRLRAVEKKDDVDDIDHNFNDDNDDNKRSGLLQKEMIQWQPTLHNNVAIGKRFL